MKTFWGFIVKEFRHILRDTRTMVILFGMPIVMLILFGFAIRNDVERVQFAVLDKSHDDVTQEIIRKMNSSDLFILKQRLDTEQQISEVFKEGHIREVIVFEPNFARRIEEEGNGQVQVITDATDPGTAELVYNYTRAILADYQVQLNRSVRTSAGGISARVKMLFNPELRSVNMFVPGLIAVILMLISALMTSISLTKEKEMGTMEVLLVSPLKPYQIILGKVLPYLILSFIDVVIIIVLALWVFHVPFLGSKILFFAEALLFIITGLSLGVFISSISNNQQTAMMIALAGLLLPTVMLSGYIFPISSMPWALQYFSNIIPAKWFLIIVKGIMLKGVGLGYVWKETLVLVGMMALFIVASAKKFKIRLE